MIKFASTDNEIANCFPVIHQLRPDLVEAEFVDYVRIAMKEGYQLAFIQMDERIVCVAGFHVAHNLSIGKHLYVDDLVTLESQRSKSYGKQMMDWLRDYAIQQQCKALHLDSGVQRHRAHKFYLNQNMDIVYYHFLQKL